MEWDLINRRRFIRIKFPFTLHLCVPEKFSISSYAENISEGGICTTIRDKVEASSDVNLEIYTEDRTLACVGKVAWIKERMSKYLEGEVFYDVGIEFRDIKDKDRQIIKDIVDNISKNKEADLE